MTRRRASIATMLLLAPLVMLLACELALVAAPAWMVPTALRTIEIFYQRRAQWAATITGDPVLGFKLRPDVDMRFPFESGAIPIRTTSYGLGPIGFRDLGTHAPFGAVVVGDSFTFCDEVVAEECWVRRLSDASGVSMATIGVSGYSTLAEARALERYGAAFAPKLVIVGIFPNDLADNVNFDNWRREGSDDLAEWLERKRAPNAAALWLERHTALYRVASAGLRARTRGVHRHREGDLDLVLRFDDWWLRVVTAPQEHPGWALMRNALLDMRASAARMGATLAVVLFPTKEDAYFDVARRYVPALESVEGDRFPRLLTKFLADEGIFGCDVTQDVREAGRLGRQLYFRVSGHFNGEGNRVAADAVQRCLTTGGLLDRRS